MSWKHVEWARAQQLPPCPKAVLMALSLRIGGNPYAFPTIATMRDDTGYGRTAIKGALRTLATRGLILIEQQPNDSSRYYLRMPITDTTAAVEQVAAPEFTPEPVRETVPPATEPVPKTVPQDTHDEPLTPAIGGLLTPENGGQTGTLDGREPTGGGSGADRGGSGDDRLGGREPTPKRKGKRHTKNSECIDVHAAKTDHAAKAARSKRKTPLPDDFGISPAIQAWAAENGFTHLDDHLEALTDWAKAKGAWCPDWDDMLKRAIRENWGLVSEAPKIGNVIDLDEYARRSREEGARFLEQREAEIQARRIAKLGGLQASAL